MGYADTLVDHGDAVSRCSESMVEETAPLRHQGVDHYSGRYGNSNGAHGNYAGMDRSG
jgi:hypothetical protein